MGLKYLVFVKVDPAVRGEWRRWMHTVHIPDVMRTGCFERCEFDYDPEADEHLITYHCRRRSDLERYFRDHAPRLQAEHTERYAGRFTARRHVMAPVEKHHGE